MSFEELTVEIVEIVVATDLLLYKFHYLFASFVVKETKIKIV